jgi:hypothetical protein
MNSKLQALQAKIQALPQSQQKEVMKKLGRRVALHQLMQEVQQAPQPPKKA